MNCSSGLQLWVAEQRDMNRNGNRRRTDQHPVLDSSPYEGSPQMAEVCSMDLRTQTVAAMADTLV